MPRYDDRDRYGGTRLYVGHLSSRTRSRDLEDVFSRYGRVRDVDMKRDYAFVEFSDPRDADDARYSLDGRDVNGSRIIVEFAKGVPRGPGGSRDFGRGPPPGTGRCFNCGVEGHWARDCKSGDWKNKCYRCGERGHIEKNCHNSPKELRRDRSYSRSPTPRRGRSRSHSYSRGRSYSRSRSPVRRERSIDRVDRYERSRRSPERRSSKRIHISPSPSPSKARKRTPASNERSPEARNSMSPRDRKEANGFDSSPRGRFRNRSRSPVNVSKGNHANSGDDRSPPERNGRSQSPSPYRREDRSRSPVDYEDEKNVSPGGSE